MISLTPFFKEHLYKDEGMNIHLDLKEVFEDTFFLALDGELTEVLFSIDGVVEVLRQGRQLLGIMPQLSNSPFLLELPSTVEEISLTYTRCFPSVEFRP